MDIYGDLNDAQREAVQAVDGPLLILAGAGSGKTKTLTHRIAHLVVNIGAWPEEILAVTFTNKAAREMRERLSHLMGRPNSRDFMPWMGTFHGICVRLLRIDGLSIEVPTNFVIYDQDDQIRLIKQAMKQLDINDKQIKPRSVAASISSAKNALVSPEEYRQTAQLPFQKSVAELYARYEALKKTACALDFDDLLNETVRMLRTNESVRQKWRSKFKYILVDEYQDTNAAQYSIIRLLLDDHNNIAVVGDDWQSIYSWRGADFTNILNFERDFANTKVVKLEQNYRSTGNILAAANLVIAKNRQRTDKKLWTAAGDGAPVQIHPVHDDNEEAAFVAGYASSQMAIGARKASDLAVLYRTNAQSVMFERAFLRYGIQYRIIGGQRFYDRREVKDILAYLRLAVQPNDIISFSRIANVPTRGVGATSMNRFLEIQASSELDLVSCLVQAEEMSSITGRSRSSLARLGQIIRNIQAKLIEGDPVGVIKYILTATEYDDYLAKDITTADERRENIGSLQSEATLYSDVSEFLEAAALLSSSDGTADAEEVTLMTLHAAKGLEFPVVFMVGLEEGLLPHSRVFDAGPEELEEERRLCYVGMTRARQELHLSHAHSRSLFGQSAYQQASRFLSDINDCAVTVGQYDSGVNAADDLAATDYFVNDFEIGDHVESAAFGIGEIVDSEGLAVTVRFDKGVTKQLNLEYARLTKISE